MINDIIADIKLKVNDHGVYGFTTEELFTTAIENSIHLANVKYLIPCLGQNYMTSFLNKDKDTLNEHDLLIYWAWVFFSISIFLEEIGNKEEQIQTAQSNSRSRGGVSKSSSGRIGKYSAASKNERWGYKMLSNAGYVRSQTISRVGIETIWRSI